MKKQLLIAAIAATMGTAAIADISITGKGMVKFINTDFGDSTADTNVVTDEFDLDVNGSHGDTTVNVHFDNNDGTLTANTKMTTSIAGVSITAGSYAGSKSILSAKSGQATKSVVSYDAGVAKISFENNATGTGSKTTIAGDIAGVAASWMTKSAQDELKLSGSVSGVSIAYHNIDSNTANSDATAVTVSGTVSGVKLTYVDASVDADAQIEGDAFFGNTASISNNGDDFSGFSAAMDVAGNTVTVKHFEQDSSTDTQDAKTNQILVTRALAAGTTLNAKYTSLDVNNGTTGDIDSLELKLSVAF
jgi:hypothetical protein